MELTIIRHHTSRWGVDGTLEINGHYVCDTVEHPVNHLSPGTYEIGLMFNEKLQKKLLMINIGRVVTTACKLTKRRCERAAEPCILPGNGPFLNTDGSIIVGERLLPGVLLHSSEYFDRVCNRVKKSIKRGEKVKLRIKEL